MILADPMLWRLVWKEYRAQRGFWLAIAGAAVGFMLLLMWLLDAQSGRFDAPWVIALSLPAFYALGSASVAFASETEEGTTDLLRIMAARSSRVFLGKVGFSLVSTLALWTCLLAAARILTWGKALPTFGGQEYIVSQVWAAAAFTVQLLAWGFLFSAVCRKVLTAVCLTGVASPLIALIVHDRVPSQPAEVAFGYPDLLMAIPLFAISYLLMARTMAGRSLDWSLPRPYWRRTSAIAELDRLAAVRETAPAWRRVCTRLVWIELRQALSLGHVLWFVGLLILVWFPLQANIPGLDSVRGIFGILLSSLLMGVWTFQAEGGRRTRFLADHGLSPQVVWLSKQLVWGMLTVVVAAPFVLAIGVANQMYVQMHMQRYQVAVSSVYHRDVPGASAITFAVALACLGYAAGQFASMLISRGVTAGFVGLVMFAVLGPWTWLMIELRIPLSISVAPLFLILLAATLGWSRHWLLEQATLRSWLRLALLTGVSVVLVWAGVGAFRVYEVPRPDFVDEIAPLREGHGLPITQEEAATATLYRQALAHLKWGAKGTEDLPISEQRSAINGWEYAAEFERRMLAENQEALRQALAATERPACAFNDPSRPISELEQDIISPIHDCPRLATLILLSARELEAQGKLDEALHRYVAVLRLARHVASRGIMPHWVDGLLIESMVSAWAPEWAAHPEQTPERIEAGARRIGQEAALFPSLRDALLTQQFMIRQALRGDWSEVLPKQNPADEPRIRMALTVFDRCCPWERARALRVLDLVDASQLHCLDVLEVALTVPGRDMQQLAKLADAVPATVDPAYDAIERQYQNVPGNRFRPGNFFDMQQAGSTHQERVPWNWLKTTFPLNMIFGGDTNHTRIWYMRLRRELSLRTMFLRLKLAAYKKTHGEYPDQLDQLGLGIDAIDPYTGTEFGYRRQGFHFPIRVTSGLRYTEEIVNAGQPFLWSAGPGNVRIFVPMAVGNAVPDQKMGNPPHPTVSRNAMTSALVFTLP